MFRSDREPIGPWLMLVGAAVALPGSLDPWGLRYAVPWFSGDALALFLAADSDWGTESAFGVLLVTALMFANAMTMLRVPSSSGLRPLIGVLIAVLGFTPFPWGSGLVSVIEPLNRSTELALGRSANIGDIGIGLCLVVAGLLLCLAGSVIALLDSLRAQVRPGTHLGRETAQP